jgi:oxygen-independent coproporphyrinogen-3 oxidase
VEEKTPLHKEIYVEKKQNVDADKQANQFLLLMKWAKENGFEHYEVSNFAKPNFRSRHNSSYWKGEKYLGLGPSAHSFNGNERKWNVANNNQYISSINSGILDFEIEKLTPIQQLNEYIMISLRTMEGLNLEYVAKKWDEKKAIEIEKGLKVYLQNGLVKRTNNQISLTNDGMLMADGIASNLFFIETK